MVGNIVIYETSLERAGVALHQQLSYNRATQVSTVNLTISRGQTLIIKMDATTGGSVNATIN
jgi:hypothetical protein